MERPCDSCGKTYEAKRPNSRFCGDTCRKRGSRGATTAVVDLGAHREPQPTLPSPHVGMLAATRRDLEAAGRVDTAFGQGALHLASRIESGDTNAGVAQMVKEWRATLDAALQNSTAAASPVEGMRDELAERRARLA